MNQKIIRRISTWALDMAPMRRQRRTGRNSTSPPSRQQSAGELARGFIRKVHEARARGRRRQRTAICKTRPRQAEHAPWSGHKYGDSGRTSHVRPAIGDGIASDSADAHNQLAQDCRPAQYIMKQIITGLPSRAGVVPRALARGKKEEDPRLILVPSRAGEGTQIERRSGAPAAGGIKIPCKSRLRERSDERTKSAPILTRLECRKSRTHAAGRNAHALFVKAHAAPSENEL